MIPVPASESPIIVHSCGNARDHDPEAWREFCLQGQTWQCRGRRGRRDKPRANTHDAHVVPLSICLQTDGQPSIHPIFQHLLQTFGQELSDFRLTKQITADQPLMLLAGERFGFFPFPGFGIAAADPE